MASAGEECTDLAAAATVPDRSCNCTQFWFSRINENFNWLNTTYRSLSFAPSGNLVSMRPTCSMRLQAFFNCNADV